MITDTQYQSLKCGDVVRGSDGVTRLRVIYVHPTSRPDEKRILFEAPDMQLFDTIMVGDKIFDPDRMAEIPLLNGDNVILLGVKDALIA